MELLHPFPNQQWSMEHGWVQRWVVEFGSWLGVSIFEINPIASSIFEQRIKLSNQFLGVE